MEDFVIVALIAARDEAEMQVNQADLKNKIYSLTGDTAKRTQLLADTYYYAGIRDLTNLLLGNGSTPMLDAFMAHVDERL